MFPDCLATWRGVFSSWGAWLVNAALVLIYPAWAYFTYRRLKALAAPATRQLKLRVYGSVILSQWLLVSGVLLVAGRQGLSVADLGQGLGLPRRTLIGTVLLLVAFLALTIINLRQVRRTPPEELSAAVHRVRNFIPIGKTEIAVFALMAVTAGICEEFLYRGWLVNVLAAATRSIWVGVVGGGALSETWVRNSCAT